MTKISLVKDKGYQWFHRDNVYFKGVIYDSEADNVYHEEEAIDMLIGKNIKNGEELSKVLESLDGVFSIIIQRDDCVFCVVDRARSLPIYISADGHFVSDSSETIRQLMGITQEGVSEHNMLELYSTGLIIGNNTAYQQIKQLDLGQYTAITDDKPWRGCYYYRHYQNADDLLSENAFRTLTEVSIDTMQKTLRMVGERPIVLSLSGGYDSRLVACLLKMCNAKDVSCYTYGKPGSPDVLMSKKIADTLGFRWCFVEYTSEMTARLLDGSGAEYISYNNQHDYSVYFQNFLAVERLHETGWIKPQSVFLTGLCGDMPTGAYIQPYEDMGSQKFDVDSVVDWVYSKLFARYELIDAQEELQKDRIRQIVESLPFIVHDYQSFWSAIDCIYTGTNHSRAFLNMNRSHEFFGYEWLLPLWDTNFLEVWYKMPAQERAKQQLYERWLFDEICRKYDLDIKKTIVRHSRTPLGNQIKRNLGGVAAFFLLHLNIPVNRKADINNFAALESVIFKRLKSKEGIKYRRAGTSLMLQRYVFELRYGVETMKKMNSYIK